MSAEGNEIFYAHGMSRKALCVESIHTTTSTIQFPTQASLGTKSNLEAHFQNRRFGYKVKDK
jgi:hypothetical protein